MTNRAKGQNRVIWTSTVLLVAVAIIGVWSLSRALGKMSDKDEAANTTTNTTVNTPSTPAQAPISSAQYAVIKTSLGDVTIQLFPADAPKTVENFVTLARRGFYDNLTFHRIVKDFVAQGGDPSGDGSGGTSIFGDTFADEINAHKLVVGAVAMANRGPNTNSSQFFIVTTKDQPGLDGSYTVFGQVVGDLSILAKFNAVPTQGDRPVTPVTIKTVVAADSLDAVTAASQAVK